MSSDAPTINAAPRPSRSPGPRVSGSPFAGAAVPDAPIHRPQWTFHPWPVFFSPGLFYSSTSGVWDTVGIEPNRLWACPFETTWPSAQVHQHCVANAQCLQNVRLKFLYPGHYRTHVETRRRSNADDAARTRSIYQNRNRRQRRIGQGGVNQPQLKRKPVFRYGDSLRAGADNE